MYQISLLSSYTRLHAQNRKSMVRISKYFNSNSEEFCISTLKDLKNKVGAYCLMEDGAFPLSTEVFQLIRFAEGDVGILQQVVSPWNSPNFLKENSERRHEAFYNAVGFPQNLNFDALFSNV